jgi:ankyrin repeat protein
MLYATLRRAAASNDVREVRRLLATTYSDHPPAQRRALLHACAERCADTADELIRAGAPLLVDPEAGVSPLMVAAALGMHRVVASLLMAGADPNDRGDRGRTALHFSAERGQYRSAQLLLSAGADGLALDNGGMTPKMLAHQAGHRRVEQIL